MSAASKALGLNRCEQPHKRKNAYVCRTGRGSAQLDMVLKLRFQGLEQGRYRLLRMVLSTQCVAKALWVFVAV